MGFSLKRVPLDFSWPLEAVWDGYLNTHLNNRDECPHCGGTGYSIRALELQMQWYGRATTPFFPESKGSAPYTHNTPAIIKAARRNCKGRSEEEIQNECLRLARFYNARWYAHLSQDEVDALVKENRLREFTHDRHPDEGWKLKQPPYQPTAQEVNAWCIEGGGHDSLNESIVIAHVCQKEGVDACCTHCVGEGYTWPSTEVKKAAESWVPVDPPEGAGFQMWETFSEGSPVSPVFAEPEQLASYMSKAYPNYGDYKNWLNLAMNGNRALA